jgi:hypothetical protein
VAPRVLGKTPQSRGDSLEAVSADFEPISSRRNQITRLQDHVLPLCHPGIPVAPEYIAELAGEAVNSSGLTRCDVRTIALNIHKVTIAMEISFYYSMSSYLSKEGRPVKELASISLTASAANV